jgi:hypothetical protein
MAGPIIITLVILLIPVAVIISLTLVAGILGHFLTKDVDDEYEGSEYLDLR